MPRTVTPCPECLNGFTPKSGNQKYCSEKCAEMSSRKRRGRYPTRINRNCDHCSKPFTTGRERQRFCSRQCGVDDYNEKWRGVNQIDVSISNGSMGAASELLVAADLILRGFHVFRSMSQACPCDLAILKGKKLWRVEVTTAYRTPTGAIQSADKSDYERHDIVAYVIRATKEIVYEPELPTEAKPKKK